MATQLKSKPGLNSTTTLSIPKDWDPTWFRNFINNQLKGADVRNAISGAGISITGNLSSPYATISASGLIASVVGTPNEIAVSTVAGVATISFAPNIIIPAPASGTPLEIDRTGDGTSIALVRSGVLSGQIGFGNAFAAGQFEIFSQGTVPMGIGTAGAAALNAYTNSVRRLNISSAGTSTFFGPNGGNVVVSDSGTLTSLSNYTIAASSFTAGTWGIGMDASDNFTIGRTDVAHTALQISLAGNSTFLVPTGAGATVTATGFAANGSSSFKSGVGTVGVAYGAFYNTDTLNSSLTMNSSGANFGTVGNTGTQTWGLGSSSTIGTMATSGGTPLQWNFGGSSNIGTVAVGPGTFTSAGSSFEGAARGVLMMNGTSDSLIDFAINGTSHAYVYNNGGVELRLNAEDSGGFISFYGSNLLAAYVTSAGSVISGSWPGFTTPTGTKSTYQRGRTDSGFLDGNYPNVETGATPGAIYSIGGNSGGTSYYPSTTTLNTMYGIGYTLGNFSGITAMGQGGAWGMYTSSAGVGRIFLSADSGNIWCTSAVVPNNGGGNALYFSGSGITIGGSGGHVTAQSGGTASGGNPGDIILIY